MSEARTGQAPDREPGRQAAGKAGPSDKPPVAQRVRDAARELFYRQGIHATGVDEIIVASGVFDHAARLRSYEIAAEAAEGLQTATA